MYILLIGAYPFPYGGEDERIFWDENLIINARYDLPIYDGQISKDASRLLRNLLKKDPNKRYSAKDALNHRWLRLDLKEEVSEVTHSIDKVLNGDVDDDQDKEGFAFDE